MPVTTRAVPLFLLLAAFPALLLGQAAADSGAMPLYTTLGDQYRDISTDDATAQAYFDQGLRLMYAFDPALALRAFEEAARHDPECAMCFWGQAWALSPYLNGGMSPAHEAQAYRAIHHAADLVASRGSPVERDLIAAFETRYAAKPNPADRSRLDSAYARAMKKVAVAHPQDDDVLTLWAESMLLLRPRYENRPLDDPQVKTIRRTLERVLDRDLRHPGACHLYIHLMEMSPEPEAAERCADILASRIPGASHIQHMPSHIYMRIGRYADAVRANLNAWHEDQMGMSRGMIPIYPGHNLEMLVYAANFGGQGAIAVDAARNLVRIQPSSAILVPETLTLFGRWEEILAEKQLPEDPFAQGGWRMARGIALIRTGDSAGAASELQRLQSLQGRVAPNASYRGASEPAILAIAASLLKGEIALDAGRTDEAIASFQDAVKTEDSFTYSEPEPWHLPSRRFLGVALLRAHRPQDAERVYRAALEDHREEGWSLFGLEQALRAQGREREARDVHARFEKAWSRSDVWLSSSRL